MTSDPPSLANESKFKTLIVVAITLAALIFMVVRPFTGQPDRDTDQKQEQKKEPAEPDANSESDEKKDDQSENKSASSAKLNSSQSFVVLDRNTEWTVPRRIQFDSTQGSQIHEFRIHE